jgi:hypothetical protein
MRTIDFQRGAIAGRVETRPYAENLSRSESA